MLNELKTSEVPHAVLVDGENRPLGWLSTRDLESETVPAEPTVGALTARLLAARPGLAAVLPVCTVLVDGLASGPDDAVPAGAAIEVLPPFAGG